MRSTANGFRCLGMACVLFLASSVQAQNTTIRAAQGSTVSRAGLLRLASPGEVVLGQQIDLIVTIPVGKPDENAKPVGFTWYEVGAKDPLTRPFQMDEKRGPGTWSVQLYTPYEKPGSYELRMFRCPYYCTTLIDVLTVKITSGMTPNAIQTIDNKKVYKPGESIDVSIVLPANRYYYGHWSGPTVIIVPMEIGGKRLNREETIKACPECSALWLGRHVLTNEAQNPSDAGASIRKDRVNTRLTVSQDKFMVDRDPKVSEQIREPFRAPQQPGRYEVRLYDRGFSFTLESYLDLYIGKTEIVVQAAPAETKETLLTRLGLMREVSGKFKPIQNFKYFARFYVEAEYKAPDGTMVLEVPWTLDGNGQIFEIEGDQENQLHAAKEKPASLQLSRVSGNLFRSKPLKVKPTS